MKSFECPRLAGISGTFCVAFALICLRGQHTSRGRTESGSSIGLTADRTNNAQDLHYLTCRLLAAV